MSLSPSKLENKNQEIFEDFQIIDASSFGCELEKPGLKIHPTFPCPICETYKNKFLCAKCVNSGSFTSSRQANGCSYSELRSRIMKTRESIEVCNISVMRNVTPTSGDFKGLSTLICALRATITHATEQNEIRRSKVAKIRKAVSQCHSTLRQITQRRSNLALHIQTLLLKQQTINKDLFSSSKKIEFLRRRFLLELLGTYFSVTLATDVYLPDQLVGASLHVDKENVFVGPEPMLSSHTALTYCVPVIHAAAVFLDVWLPLVIRQNLHLSGPFLTVLPQRDNLGRVYSAVLHAVHMLCASRGCQLRSILQKQLPECQLSWRLPGTHSEYNPLLGLYCLSIQAQVAADENRLFDEPYSLTLDGFFGTVGLPTTLDPRYQLAVDCLQLETNVELGEEMKESEETNSLAEEQSGKESQPDKPLSIEIQ